jgi:hypothetical protein
VAKNKNGKIGNVGRSNGRIAWCQSRTKKRKERVHPAVAILFYGVRYLGER